MVEVTEATGKVKEIYEDILDNFGVVPICLDPGIKA